MEVVTWGVEGEMWGPVSGGVFLVGWVFLVSGRRWVGLIIARVAIDIR